MRVYASWFVLNHLLRLLLVVSIVSFPFLNVAQPLSPKTSGRFVMPEGVRYLPNKVVCKFWPEFRSFCQPHAVQIPAFTDQVKVLGPVQFVKSFPTSTPPTSPVNSLGQEMADLSLIYTLSFDTLVVSVESVVQFLQSRPEIAYAEPWYLAEVFYHPNDPYADTTGGIDLMWHLGKIKAREAWQIQQDGGEVVVGIIDTGINSGHPDLQDNRALNTDDPIDGLDNDGDGYMDNHFGWDFGGDLLLGPGDSDPNVGNVHGLWVTGIVGASTNNSIGIPSLCLDCKYIPIKASPDDQIGFVSNGYDGIVYAVDQGAQVVNCSWGSSIRTRLGEDVVQYTVVNKQAALICAAGNSTSDRKFYPAAYDLSLSIVNTTFPDTLCCNSTFNYTADVAAPGTNIWSTFASNDYWRWSGTSASAPVVSGAVALTLAHFPTYTGFQAAQRVRVTSDDIYSLNPIAYVDKLGTGRVNMLRALTDPLKPSIRTTKRRAINLNEEAYFQSGDTMQVDLSFINYLDTARNLRVQMIAPGFFASYLTVLDGELQQGEVAMGESFQSGNSFLVKLGDNLPPDFLIALKLVYTDPATSYSDFEVIEFRVNKSYVDITENQLHTSMNSRGNFGFNDYLFQEQGLGIQYQQSLNALFEGGLMVGNSPIKVMDRIRNNNPGSRDNEFSQVENAHVVPHSSRADFEAKTIFTDGAVPANLGMNITQYAFAYDEPDHQDYVIFQFILSNTTNFPLINIYSGLFADWDIYPFLGLGQTNNAADYDVSHKLAYSYDVSGNVPHHYGMSLLSSHDMKTFAKFNDGSFSFSSAGKYQALSTNPQPQTGTIGDSNLGGDVIQVLAGGPVNIPKEGKDTIAFALLAGADLDQLQLTQERALERYRCRILDLGPNRPLGLPTDSAYAFQSIQFTDSNAQATAWTWDFGDGNSSTSAAPSHAYEKPGSYIVSLTVEQANCERTYMQSIHISPPVGISSELLSNFIQIHPNPSHDSFELIVSHSLKGDIQISMTNLMGEVVWQDHQRKNSEVLQLTIQPGRLAAGIYFLQLSGKGWSAVKKVVRE
ncbi:MAG: S8 family serine peptidase [Bacteroidota bacterium]